MISNEQILLAFVIGIQMKKMTIDIKHGKQILYFSHKDTC